MFVLCVGMYRASSTWQYEVASDLVERHLGGRRIGIVYPSQLAGSGTGLPEDTWQVLKFHDANQPMADALVDGRAVCLYSFRDLRDVVFSLMHKFNASFEEIVEGRQFIDACLRNDAFWRSQPGVLCQRYEELIRHPAAGINEIARHLEIELPAGEAQRLADKYSLQANRARAEALSRRLVQAGCDLADPANSLQYDPESLLHWNHLREGTAGGWSRQASLSQVLWLASRCGDWLIEQGYERDFKWALERAEGVARENERLIARIEQIEAQLEALPSWLPLGRRLHELRRRVRQLAARAA
ncbi:MAG: sulfotransferase domain-containing protein [Pirellulales bacterium]